MRLCTRGPRTENADFLWMRLSVSQRWNSPDVPPSLKSAFFQGSLGYEHNGNDYPRDNANADEEKETHKVVVRTPGGALEELCLELGKNKERLDHLTEWEFLALSHNEDVLPLIIRAEDLEGVDSSLNRDPLREFLLRGISPKLRSFPVPVPSERFIPACPLMLCSIEDDVHLLLFRFLFRCFLRMRVFSGDLD